MKYAVYLWHRARLRVDLNRHELRIAAVLAATALVVLATIVMLVTLRWP